MSQEDPFAAKVVVVRGEDAERERYRVLFARGDELRLGEQDGPEERVELIGPKTVGALGIHLSLVKVPPRYKDGAHFHIQGEKVMYITAGSGTIHWGDELQHAIPVEAGDAIYVPPYAIHAPENPGDDPFEFVMATSAPLDVTVPA